MAATIAAIAAAVIAAAGTAYSASQQKKAAQRGKRTAANAGALSGGGVDEPGAPTAYRFAGGEEDKGGGGARLSGVLGQSDPATSKEQGLSLGLKSLGDDVQSPQPSREFNFDTGAPNAATSTDAANKIMPVEQIKQQPAQTQQPAAGGDISSYAAIAQSLYQAYEASKAAKPQPGLPAQAGPMNTRPTAYQFGLPR